MLLLLLLLLYFESITETIIKPEYEENQNNRTSTAF